MRRIAAQTSASIDIVIVQSPPGSTAAKPSDARPSSSARACSTAADFGEGQGASRTKDGPFGILDDATFDDGPQLAQAPLLAADEGRLISVQAWGLGGTRLRAHSTTSISARRIDHGATQGRLGQRYVHVRIPRATVGEASVSIRNASKRSKSPSSTRMCYRNARPERRVLRSPVRWAIDRSSSADRCGVGVMRSPHRNEIEQAARRPGHRRRRRAPAICTASHAVSIPGRRSARKDNEERSARLASTRARRAGNCEPSDTKASSHNARHSDRHAAASSSRWRRSRPWPAVPGT